MSYRSYVLVGSCAAFMLCAHPLTAQTPGDCSLGTAQQDLDANNVRARVFNTGSLAFGNGNVAQYVVPKPSGHSPIYASSIWIGGRVDGELRMAAATYYDFEFWPGPLGTDGRPVDPSNCSDYDRIWNVSASDIRSFERNGIATPDLASWPHQLGAPVIDGDGNPDNYDLAAGDRPELVGDEAAWWVMNDVGNVHPQTETPPLGMEVRVHAFSAASGDAINETTFYRYELVYKGDAPLEDAYFSIWTDVDLGGASDDHVGVDTTRNLGFGYNLEPTDRVYGTPPAVGYHLLQGAVVDGERLEMTRFTYTINGGPLGTEGATTAEGYYNLMQGRWRDGVPVTEYGLGYDRGGDTTLFALAGDPVTEQFWSALNSDGAGADLPGTNLNMIVTTGPFTMQPGDVQEIVVAVVWAQGEDHLASITELRAASDLAQQAYEGGFQDFTTPLPPGPSAAPTLVAPADGATGQPVNSALRWRAVADAEYYQVEWSGDPAFPDSTTRGNWLQTRDGHTFSPPWSGFPSDSTIYWHVRGWNSGGFGPWSDTRRLETSDVLLEAPGPLMLHPNSPAFLEVQAPGGVAACPGGDRCGEFGGDYVSLDFNSTRQYFRYHIGPGSEESIGAFAPRTFEIRLVPPEEGSYVFHRLTDGIIVKWPIQVWDVGVMTPGEENEPSDDVRLIPVAYSDSGGECAFNFGEGEVLEYPATDRISAYYPAPGGTYADWAAYAEAEVGAAGCAAPSGGDDGLIDFDQGSPLQNEVLGVVDSTLVVADLEGAIIRYYTTPSGLMAPIPSTPADSSLQTLETVTLGWNVPPGAETARVQMATSAGFEQGSMLVDSSGLAGAELDVAGLVMGRTYYWRVRGENQMDMSDWSPVWTFRVGEAEEDPEPEPGSTLPEDYVLSPSHPNPFVQRTTIEYGLPEAAEVRLTVYDMLGRRVAVIEEGQQEAGWQEVEWAPERLASGVYAIRMEAGGILRTTTVVRVR